MKKVPHVLLVEDEALSAMFLEMSLKQAGATVTTVGFGEKAVEQFRQRGADLVLMDVHLAGTMDGMETARRILAESPARIVFMTGYAEESLQSGMAEIEGCSFLSKPVDMDALYKLVFEVGGGRGLKVMPPDDACRY